MQLITRRTLVAAGATLAALAPLRKPQAAEQLQGMSALMMEGEGKRPPAISFLDKDGKKHTLAEYVGRGVVLNLWATWCAPCVAELPSLDRLYAILKPRGIDVLALSSDHGGAPVVEKFYADHGIKNLAVLLDPMGEAAQAFRVRGVPTTYIINRTGDIRAYLEGGANWAEGADVIEKLALA
jgi:peroxiredoxin